MYKSQSMEIYFKQVTNQSSNKVINKLNSYNCFSEKTDDDDDDDNDDDDDDDDTKITQIENKILHTSNFITNINFNTKVKKNEDKITNITDFSSKNLNEDSNKEKQYKHKKS